MPSFDTIVLCRQRVYVIDELDRWIISHKQYVFGQLRERFEAKFKALDDKCAKMLGEKVRCEQYFCGNPLLLASQHHCTANCSAPCTMEW